MTDVVLFCLRFATGITMVLYGAHQIARPRRWLSYIPNWLEGIIPVQSEHFMITHGVGNLTLGLLFLLDVKPEFVYWLVLSWWAAILPFTYYEDWRDGLRDTIIIAGIIVLIHEILIKPKHSRFTLFA